MDASAALRAVPTVAAPATARLAVGMWLAVTMIGCSLLLGALHHPYWVRGGDGDVYIGLARSIATGQGYRFNGQPISLVPPLWPVVLAGAMKLTSAFYLLKLIQIGLLLAGFGAFYFVLLRLTSPRNASMILLATALLPNVHELVFSFLAEPMFFALFALALLLAIQINEGHDSIWRIFTLCLLCAAMVAVRWAGLIIWVVPAAALLGGELFPRLNRKWLTLALSGATAALTFFLLRWWLDVPEEQIDWRFDSSLSGAYAAVNPATWDDYIKRIIESGRWLAGLFWQFLASTTYLRALLDVVGWSSLALLLIGAFTDLPRRRWLYAGVVLYGGMLVINWTSPVPRYLMPLAPLLLAGMLDGIEGLKGILNPQAARRAGVILPCILILSIMICGAVLWSIEARIAQSRRFPARLFAGTDRELVAAAAYLRSMNVKDGDVAVSRATINFGRTSYTNGWMRAFNVLVGGPAIVTPSASRSRTPDSTVMRWLRGREIKYYLYRAPQQLDSTHSAVPMPKKRGLPAPVWNLYEVSSLKPRLIHVPQDVEWPTHVPGLNGDRDE